MNSLNVLIEKCAIPFNDIPVLFLEEETGQPYVCLDFPTKYLELNFWFFHSISDSKRDQMPKDVLSAWIEQSWIPYLTIYLGDEDLWIEWDNSILNAYTEGVSTKSQKYPLTLKGFNDAVLECHKTIWEAVALANLEENLDNDDIC